MSDKIIEMRLRNRVAVVTGAGSGIGKAIAVLFAQEGARVVVVDIIEERAAETVNSIIKMGLEAIAIIADVSDAQSVDQLGKQTIDQYKNIDILINNAAYSAGDNILDIEEANWDANLNVTLKSVYLCSKAMLPIMIAQKRGVILNISSVNGVTGFGLMGYSAAKAGVNNLTQNLAIEYGKYNIRVNAICPGTVRTPVWENRLKSDPTLFDSFAKWYPLGRVGEPSDIAKAALFLVSDDASWITGTILVVDGGLTAGYYKILNE